MPSNTVLVRCQPELRAQRCYPLTMRRSLLILLLAYPMTVAAASDCLAMAKTALEKIYCQVAATPEAGKLPSFSDFRRNNSQVQAMLLKAPARRLGIELPSNATQQRSAPVNPNPSPAPRQSVAVVSTPAATPATTKPQKPPSQTPSANPKAVDPLQGCQLSGERIRCPSARYDLVDNLDNKHLAPGVLGAGNELGLVSYRGDLGDTNGINNYLADSYEHYVNKMLVIGLGGSTMTYTKFHYTFWELVEKREDFAGRVNQMYAYLKQDKASMAVKSRYLHTMPAAMDWCQLLNTTVVICDDGKNNWVYSKTVD